MFLIKSKSQNNKQVFENYQIICQQMKLICYEILIHDGIQFSYFPYIIQKKATKVATYIKDEKQSYYLLLFLCLFGLPSWKKKQKNKKAN